MERRVRVVRTTKTVRGKRYRDYYIKIHLPERIAERVEEYVMRLDEETGRIVLEPVYKRGGEGGRGLGRY
ncbi:hypothetical protein [Pyrodictium delaneyi]|uniref:Uncharacterized protein n=1 Tax=Pyrodictium delaneyi TaxID=1273541 RepID=A0A211YRW7_9CREN|nr:hypothetical protein [Pyrodictium delaneyi]OWJ55803.1 hypothetical protein Pdsh_02095 [Pyrodictium delaneyi]